MTLSEEQMPPSERLKDDMKDIDRQRDRLLRQGIQAFNKKHFERAEHYLRQAVQLDMLDESEACYYPAITRLWQGDFVEASYLFDMDQQDREGEAPLSWLFAEWCTICAASSRPAYLTAVRDQIEDGEDPLSYRQAMFAFDYEECEDEAIQAVAAALFAYLHGDYEACLDHFEGFEPDGEEIPSWVVPFWSAMAMVALGQNADADSWLQQALAEGIPPLFLLPLCWFEHSHPAFYEQTVRPLFNELDLWPQVAARNEHEQMVQRERRQQYAGG